MKSGLLTWRAPPAQAPFFTTHPNYRRRRARHPTGRLVGKVPVVQMKKTPLNLNGSFVSKSNVSSFPSPISSTNLVHGSSQSLFPFLFGGGATQRPHLPHSLSRTSLARDVKMEERRRSRIERVRLRKEVLSSRSLFQCKLYQFASVFHHSPSSVEVQATAFLTSSEFTTKCCSYSLSYFSPLVVVVVVVH